MPSAVSLKLNRINDVLLPDPAVPVSTITPGREEESLSRTIFQKPPSHDRGIARPDCTSAQIGSCPSKKLLDSFGLTASFETSERLLVAVAVKADNSPMCCKPFLALSFSLDRTLEAKSSAVIGSHQMLYSSNKACRGRSRDGITRYDRGRSSAISRLPRIFRSCKCCQNGDSSSWVPMKMQE